MEVFCGKKVVEGIAIGKIYYYSKEEGQIRRVRIEDTESELLRYESAKYEAVEQLARLYDKAVKEVGVEQAEIFEVQSMMLSDEDYNQSVYNIIKKQKVNTEYAVAVSGENFSKMFEGMSDEYFKSRSVDVKDVSERIINILLGKSTDANMDDAAIVVAKEIAPSETIQMNKSNLLGFVTEEGSVNSHTAILAKTMNIPVIIGIEIKKEWHGKTAIIDGYKGTLTLEPDEASLHMAMSQKENDTKEKEVLSVLKGKSDITRDGRRIDLFANISNSAEVASVLENGGRGVGLFRSEFMYLGKTDFPTEEELFRVYKLVAENMAGKKVIIRTIDIGADKQADYFGTEKEKNPAMGYRAIRYCLDVAGGSKGREVFKTQLRAIYRASAFGNVAVMFPMIISVKEVMKIKALMSEVENELMDDNIPFSEIETGIMIETPAAVMISDDLAKMVDFVSIGTNDLTQYTLAIDRQNEKLESIYNSRHKAILRMIEMVVNNAHKENCKVAICGELAADTSLTRRFIEMGVDELSVTPSMILKVRKAIREV